MTWMYKGSLVNKIPITTEPVFGFVYVITNTITGKKYIGCKQFFSYRKTVRESNWKGYYGSSKDLLADIKKLGKSNFQREIIHLCPTKWDLLYMEAREQFLHDVLKSDNYYNKWINITLGKIVSPI